MVYKSKLNIIFIAILLSYIFYAKPLLAKSIDENETMLLSYNEVSQDNKIAETTTTDQKNINKNLLLPTQTPGFLPTDIDRTRQYYNNMSDFNPKKESPKKDEGIINLPNIITDPEKRNVDELVILIKEVTISKSSIFSDDELEKFKSLVRNKKVTASDLNNLVYTINNEYQKRRYITAKAFIPVADLEGGILHIELLEARIGKIIVEKNRFNRTFFIKSWLSQKEGDVFDLTKLENDLKNFNKQSRGVYLRAKLKPGKEYGTTDIIITASETIPLHLTSSYDNFGRDNTGLQRGGIVTSLDSVIGIQDRLTNGVNLSRGSISSFTDYSIPLNKKGTRLGGSYMFGNTDISDGIYKSFDINSKTNAFAIYLVHPLVDKNRFSLSSNTSVNFKNSDTTISQFSYTKMRDMNLAVGVNGRYNFNNGVLYSSQYVTNGFISDKKLDTTSYFTKYNGDAFYIHYFKHGIILTAKAGVQYVPQDVSFMEQYQIGGISTVRGFSEGLFLGQTAYFGSLETLLPIPLLPKEVPIPFTENKKFKLRDNIKFAAFTDHGAVYRNGETTTHRNYLTSAGLGLRVSLTKFITARLYWGFGIGKDREINQPTARFHFDLISAPF